MSHPALPLPLPWPLRLTALVAGCAALSVLAACEDPGSETQAVGLANPASVYCVDSGGRSEIRSDSTGQTGVCVLPDGSEVDEWEYYRANAPA